MSQSYVVLYQRLANRSQCMDKIYRNGVDMGVAFSVNTNRLFILRNPQESDDLLLQNDFKQKKLNSLIKKLIRPLARSVFSLTKWIVRPFAFRLRRYWIDLVRQEMQANHVMVQNELIKNQVLLLEEIRVMKATLLQEFQQLMSEKVVKSDVNVKLSHEFLS